MTRICEKFVEELTSGNAQFSTELREHLASCPDCMQAADSLNLLKSHRKPVSGREAAAIAAVLKAAKADAAISASAAGNSVATTAASATPVLRYVLLSLLGLAIVSSYVINNTSRQQAKSLQAPPPLRHIQPVQPLKSDESPAHQGASLTPPDIAEINSIPHPDPEVASLPGDVNKTGNATEEAAISTATEVKMVSPDAEEVSP